MCVDVAMTSRTPFPSDEGSEGVAGEGDENGTGVEG